MEFQILNVAFKGNKLPLILSIFFVVFTVVFCSYFSSENFLIKTFSNRPLIKDKPMDNFEHKNTSNQQDYAPVVKYARTAFCNRTIVPEHLIQEETWLPVDVRNSMLVFSAYFNAHIKSIHVIGLRIRKDFEAICQLWYATDVPNRMNVLETKALIALPEEGWASLKYTSTIFECHLNLSMMPVYVSIVKTSCQAHRNLLRVKDVTPVENYQFKYTVCLSPLFNIQRANELVEWIELNRILGADRFVIYNLSTAANVQPILNYYSKRGLAEVIRWRPEVKLYGNRYEELQTNYHAQTASLNDCLYRNKRTSEFIVNVDLDEFIIPHSRELKHWTEMISLINVTRNAYLFRSTIFFKEWENKTSENDSQEMAADSSKLITLKLFKHDPHTFSYFERTKYIARTQNHTCILIHSPCNRASMVDVPVEIGFIHHYRSWSHLTNKSDEGIIDYTIKELFGKELIRNVEKVDWDSESECFETFSREMSEFYAVKKSLFATSEQDEDKTHSADAKNRLSWQWTVEHVIFPALRSLFYPPKKFAEDSSVLQIANLPDLYKVFERC